MALQQHFHQIITKSEEEKYLDSTTRTFEGDGTPILLVPGLKKVARVRLGHLDLPITMEEKVNADPDCLRHEIHTHEMVHLDTMPDGTAVLLRSIKSNDGVWQKGARIHVSGEWEPVKVTTQEIPQGNPADGAKEEDTKVDPKAKTGEK